MIGFSYVAVCLLFSSLFSLHILRIRRRRKVHVRYLICDEFLVSFIFAILNIPLDVEIN